MKGIICIWSGAIVDIPNGWALCDGTNGTPDLRSKFIFGASPLHPPGGFGGAYIHNHALDDPGHSHWIADGMEMWNHWPDGHLERIALTETTGITIDPANHMPPYWRLAYIMKL